MRTIETSSGKKIEIIRIGQGGRFPILHIYTNSISAGEAWDVFNDPEETKHMIASDTEHPGEDKILDDYTELTSVQKAYAEAAENAIMIRLEKPNVLLVRPEEPKEPEVENSSSE